VDDAEQIILKKIIDIYREHNLTFEEAYALTDKTKEALDHLSKLGKI